MNNLLMCSVHDGDVFVCHLSVSKDEIADVAPEDNTNYGVVILRYPASVRDGDIVVRSDCSYSEAFKFYYGYEPKVD